MSLLSIQRKTSFVLAISVALANTPPCWAATPKKNAKATSTSAAPAPVAAAPAPVAATPASPAGPKSLSDTLTGDAKADYEAGKLLYGDGDYAGARVKLFAAYDLSHDPRLLWNVAACEKGQRHYAKVATLVQLYLKTGGDLLTDDDRKEAQDLLNAIEAFTVGLSITVSEPDAQIFVDGTSVGASPLPGAVTVDIGTRQIEVQKPGFLKFSKSLAVGGNKQAALDVKLEREVHEGELTVNAPPKATILIDSKPVGVGRFVGKLPSGGHTLHVDAPGFRAYQSEVVIQDHEKRGVDVVLEPNAAPGAAPAVPEEPTGALHGLELGLHTGYATQRNVLKSNGTQPRQNADVTSIIPIGIDIGYRLGRPTYLGFFGEYGTLDRSDTCGIVVHGPHPDFPGDGAVRYGFTSCSSLAGGLQLVFHLLPRTIVDPYFGFEVMGQTAFTQYRSFDPTNGHTNQGKDNNFELQTGMRLGIDTHPIPTLGAGIYTTLAASVGGSQPPNDGNACSSNSGNNGSDVGCPGAGLGSYFMFGLRVAYTFQ
ncbi:MAG TPA: PEGA domain-containing protein [Polyangiaceae bacterium]